MFALLLAACVGAGTAPAAPTKDQLIDGVLGNYSASLRLPCLKVAYTIDFEALSKPPRFAFKHLELVNLFRAGAYRTEMKATGVREVETAKESRTSTWDGKVGMTA